MTPTDRVFELFGIASESLLGEQALTHPSYANEVRSAGHYQRLEFLGDAVLGLCVSELIYERFPEADEGSLTRIRAHLVNAEALASWAREEQVGVSLRLGRGAEANGLRDSTNVLADLVESLVAVAYLEGGLDSARTACRRVFGPALTALEADSGRDPKSELQERVQKSGEPAPVYEAIESRGTAHEPWFVVVVRVGERELGRGEGRAKRIAERAAATQALAALDDPGQGPSEPGAER